MIFSLIEKKLKDETGIVSVVSLMVLVTLTISGVVAINMANNETNIARNEQISTNDFYNAETGINDARINFNNWLTDDFLTDAQTAANSTFDSIAEDADGNPMASIQVRCIENNGTGDTVSPIFGDVADEVPAMAHIAAPPEGSGYSLKYFETRRYGITSTSGTGSMVVQAGVWKVFNKY